MVDRLLDRMKPGKAVRQRRGAQIASMTWPMADHALLAGGALAAALATGVAEARIPSRRTWCR